MKKLFGGIKMSWLTTIIFAVVAGVYTGAIMLVPMLKETSFQDIGISYEWWVVFAVIIVVNCNKNWEAMLKCFVFFLISQPLVYAVEILFGDLTLELAKSYYFNMWLPMTFATLPGGFIAYYCKKQNVLGSIVLGLGNTILAVMGTNYLGMAVKDFPHHLLTALFSFAAIILMTLCIQKEKKNKIIAIAIPVVLTVALIVFARLTGRTFI